MELCGSCYGKFRRSGGSNAGSTHMNFCYDKMVFQQDQLQKRLWLAAFSNIPSTSWRLLTAEELAAFHASPQRAFDLLHTVIQGVVNY